jgi:hypothetical protein
VCKDDAEVDRVRKEQDDLLQTVARLHVEHDLAWQECDDSCGWVNDLLGEVKMERGLKLKVEDVSAGLTMEVARDKEKIHTLETVVS